jgi:predicted N-acetyltransferase YhbS
MYIDAYLKQTDSSSFVALISSGEDETLVNPEVIGFANIHLIKRPRGGQVAYLGEVLVSEAWRARGVASALVKTAVIAAKSSHCNKVVLHCPSSLVNFYQKIGFENWDSGMSISFPNN